MAFNPRSQLSFGSMGSTVSSEPPRQYTGYHQVNVQVYHQVNVQVGLNKDRDLNSERTKTDRDLNRVWYGQKQTELES